MRFASQKEEEKRNPYLFLIRPWGWPGVTYLLFPVIIVTILQVTQFTDEKTRVK